MCKRCELIKQAQQERAATAPATPIASDIHALGRVIAAFGYDVAKTNPSFSTAEAVETMGAFFLAMIDEAPDAVRDSVTEAEVIERGGTLMRRTGKLCVDLARQSGITRDLIEPCIVTTVQRLADDMQGWIGGAAHHAELAGLTHDACIRLACDRAMHCLRQEMEAAKTYAPSEAIRTLAAMVVEQAENEQAQSEQALAALPHAATTHALASMVH